MTTIVKGNKLRPTQDQNELKNLIRNERKYGDFTLTFKIPEIYQKKWTNYQIRDGVLIITYDKDQDEATN